MEILFYQGFIFISIVLTRIFKKSALGLVCCLWTLFTVFNLFYPPLIILQLAVVWITYSWLSDKTETSDDITAEPIKPEFSEAPSKVIFGRSTTLRELTRSETLPATTPPIPPNPPAVQPLQTPPDVPFGGDIPSKNKPSPDKPNAQVQDPAAPQVEETPSLVKPRPIQEYFNERFPPPLTETEYDEHVTRSKPYGASKLNRRKAIEKIINEKNISYLVHFTRAENLQSILESGVLSVEAMNGAGITHFNNDKDRWDNRLDGISLSIASPNSKMFYKYRKLNPGSDWAVLLIHPSVLWQKDCAFFKHNAADSRVRNIRRNELATPFALKGMFEDKLKSRAGKTLARTEQNLGPSQPTDEQAEVLVFDTITPKEIIGIFFEDSYTKSRYESVAAAHTIMVETEKTGIFSSRRYVHDKKIRRDSISGNMKYRRRGYRPTRKEIPF